MNLLFKHSIFRSSKLVEGLTSAEVSVLRKQSSLFDFQIRKWLYKVSFSPIFFYIFSVFRSALPYLRVGHLLPDVLRAELAELDLVEHVRLNPLHVVVKHRHRDDAHERRDGGDGDAKEGDKPEAVRLADPLLVGGRLVHV